MKELLILCIALSLLLSSCSIDWKDEKDKKIMELEKEIQYDTFKKKQECAKYKEEMTKQLLELGSLHGVIIIDEIFYSKKENTCYYTSYGTKGYILFDYLNNKFSDSSSNNNLNDIKRLREKIKELKGE